MENDVNQGEDNEIRFEEVSEELFHWFKIIFTLLYFLNKAISQKLYIVFIL